MGDATEIKVKLSDGREFMAKVVGKDPPTDVALIRLEKAPHDLPTVALGDSDALEQGDFVLALGNPFGLSGSASFGMVSAKARSLQNGPFDDFIQTDAAINPGNSGGPLFNMKGEVVGINTAIVSPQIGQGIGFAVPISLAKQLLPQLEKGSKIARGYLGVTVGDLTPELARGFGLAEGLKGAVVQDVVANAPAGKAGVKAGDVVTSVNGKAGRGSRPAHPHGREHPARRQGQPRPAPEGQEARDHRDRGDQAGRGGARPRARAREEGETANEGPASAKGAKLGIRLQALTADQRRQMKIDGEVGVLVADVLARRRRGPVRHPARRRDPRGRAGLRQQARPGDGCGRQGESRGRRPPAGEARQPGHLHPREDPGARDPREEVTRKGYVGKGRKFDDIEPPP